MHQKWGARFSYKREQPFFSEQLSFKEYQQSSEPVHALAHANDVKN